MPSEVTLGCPTALDNLKQHGYVQFIYDYRVRQYKASKAQLRSYKTHCEDMLSSGIVSFLTRHPGIGSWDGSIRRTSMQQTKNFVQYRFIATVYALNPFE